MKSVVEDIKKGSFKLDSIVSGKKCTYPTVVPACFVKGMVKK